MPKKLLCTLIFFSFSFLTISLSAQEVPCGDSLISRVDGIPDSVTRDPAVFAAYLHSVFPADECAAKALYTWLARKMYYDLDMLEKPPNYKNAREMVQKTLENRHGVCAHYAETFRDVLSRTGVQVVVISGYTRIDNKVNIRVGHAWNAALISGKWMLFDATWGGGFQRFERYHRRFSTKYCMIPPDSMITDHMPFDPIWQLSGFPVKHDGFFAGQTKGSETFAWQDSIASYLAGDSCSRMVPVRLRCLRFNIAIPQLDYLREQYFKEQRNVGLAYSYNKYNQAIALYNRLSDEYNSLAIGKNSRKLNRSQQKLRLEQLNADLPVCKAAVEERNCPDGTLIILQNKLRSSLATLEDLIRQISKSTSIFFK